MSKVDFLNSVIKDLYKNFEELTIFLYKMAIPVVNLNHDHTLKTTKEKMTFFSFPGSKVIDFEILDNDVTLTLLKNRQISDIMESYGYPFDDLFKNDSKLYLFKKDDDIKLCLEIRNHKVAVIDYEKSKETTDIVNFFDIINEAESLFINTL